MNPWGGILVAFGILLIMIGITGSQHKILQVFKGVPTAARGGPATRAAANPQTPGSTGPGVAPVVTAA